MSQQFDPEAKSPVVDSHSSDGTRVLRSLAGLGGYFPGGSSAADTSPLTDVQPLVEEPVSEPQSLRGLAGLGSYFPSAASQPKSGSETGFEQFDVSLPRMDTDSDQK